MAWGLPGLFLLSFVAATVFPVASEAGLAAAVLSGLDPLACVSMATLGNTAGAVTTWALGRWGSRSLLHRLLRMDETDRERAERMFSRYGSWSLLLAWAPVIGDPLCLIAGLFNLSLPRFLPPVFIGKLVRYGVIAWMTVRVTG